MLTDFDLYAEPLDTQSKIAPAKKGRSNLADFLAQAAKPPISLPREPKSCTIRRCVEAAAKPLDLPLPKL
jgi:hypothetical protein